MTDQYVFVYNRMHILGGIQSIVLRCAAELIRRGKRVAIVGENSPPPSIGLEGATIVTFPKGRSPQEIARQIPTSSEGINLVVSMDPLSASLALILCSFLGNRPKSSIRYLHGVFHPRDFARESEKRHVHMLNRGLARAIGRRSMFFMNVICRESHEKILLQDLSSSEIIPVPIDDRLPAWRPRSIDCVKVCSVGRIVPFKAYNFEASRIVRQALDLGVPVLWDVYGHGSGIELLRKTIEDERVEEHVVFRGSLDPCDFDRTVVSYDLFVGMGTAALQAAQMGVPTLCAIDGEGESCYGFLHEVPHGIVGEAVAGLSRVRILDAVVQFSTCSLDERRKISAEGVRAANKYSVGSFLQALNDTGRSIGGGPRQWFAFKYASFYYWTNQDSYVKRLYRAVRPFGRWIRPE